MRDWLSHQPTKNTIILCVFYPICSLKRFPSMISYSFNVLYGEKTVLDIIEIIILGFRFDATSSPPKLDISVENSILLGTCHPAGQILQLSITAYQVYNRP